MKVIILEDDYRVAMIHTEYVKKYLPYVSCETFYQVDAFVERINGAKEPFDLLLLDLFLPHTHGFEMIRYVRERMLSLDIIVITAANDRASILEAKRWGVLDYLTKPVMEDRLKESLYFFVAWKSKIERNEQWNQQQIDEVFHFNVQTTRKKALPKGIQQETLERIAKEIREQSMPQTASELAASIGLSRSTVRRYLEFLVEENKLEMNLDYQSVGRPRRVYVIREQKEQKEK